MTLDEAIEHARDKAKINRKYADALNTEEYDDKESQYCALCAEEHEQLAEWLKELKELREFKAIYQKGMDYSYAIFKYNKAIDDLTEKIVGYGTYDDYGNVIDILKIAEELKECAE